MAGPFLAVSAGRTPHRFCFSLYFFFSCKSKSCSSPVLQDPVTMYSPPTTQSIPSLKLLDTLIFLFNESVRRIPPPRGVDGSFASYGSGLYYPPCFYTFVPPPKFSWAVPFPKNLSNGPPLFQFFRWLTLFSPKPFFFVCFHCSGYSTIFFVSLAGLSLLAWQGHPKFLLLWSLSPLCCKLGLC